jgi:hypothetical protein
VREKTKNGSHDKKIPSYPLRFLVTSCEPQRSESETIEGQWWWWATCGESLRCYASCITIRSRTHTHTHTPHNCLSRNAFCIATHTSSHHPTHARVTRVHTHGARHTPPAAPPLMQAFCVGFSPSASHFCCSLLLFAQASSSIKSAPRTVSECVIAIVRPCLSASRTTLL